MGGGIAIIDVPNMDWFWNGHERYMDFTHEVGFTPESLEQICNKVFGNSIIHYCVTPRIYDKGFWWKNIVNRIMRAVVINIMWGCEPAINKKSVMTRDIIAVVTK